MPARNPKHTCVHPTDEGCHYCCEKCGRESHTCKMCGDSVEHETELCKLCERQILKE